MARWHPTYVVPMVDILLLLQPAQDPLHPDGEYVPSRVGDEGGAGKVETVAVVWIETPLDILPQWKERSHL